MAKVQYGAFITELKGSIGGSTFQSSRTGNTVRNKPIAPKTPSAAQNILRAWWRVISQSWRALDPAERDAWNAVAINWPAVDAFGNPITLNGFEVYMRASFWLKSVGEAINPTASNPAVLFDPDFVSFACSVSGGTMDIEFNNSPIPAGTAVVVAVSPPMSQGSSVRPSVLRSLTLMEATDSSLFDISGPYGKAFGMFPPEGTRVTVSMVVVDTANGTPSAPFYLSSIVQA